MTASTCDVADGMPRLAAEVEAMSELVMTGKLFPAEKCIVPHWRHPTLGATGDTQRTADW